MRKILLLFVLFLVLPFTLMTAAPGVGRAAVACDLSSQAKQLATAQTDISGDELQQFRTELEARRQLLAAAIACDQNEIAALKSSLNRMPEDLKSLPAHGRIMEGLANAAHYYEEQQSGIPRMGARDIKNVSRSMAAWRARTYLPLVALGDNFVFWADNQQFLDRASGRLTQAARLAFSLKLVSQSEAAEKLKKAQSSYEAAMAENDRARDALNEGRAADGLAHVKTSLQSLAESYRIFLDLQESLQKIVSNG